MAPRPKSRQRLSQATSRASSRSAAGSVLSSLPVRPESLPRWTFLTNHAHVLILLYQESCMVLREVASRIGITERAVQRIVADLEQDGFIEREKVGRQNQYRISATQPLRHPIESHRTIGDLIMLITKHSG